MKELVACLGTHDTIGWEAPTILQEVSVPLNSVLAERVLAAEEEIFYLSKMIIVLKATQICMLEPTPKNVELHIFEL